MSLFGKMQNQIFVIGIGIGPSSAFFVADAFLHRSEKFGMCGAGEIESGPQGGGPVLSIGADLRKHLETCKMLTKLAFILEL